MLKEQELTSGRHWDIINKGAEYNETA